ncbi:MAG TPA: tRNA glutamyl-Q(34) synthetase GluQRS [Polyangiaceae bacterium]|nr:tRNA glutamyl-Q(34) synthetase GluQRS [Polyangiaceae bacterium]
MSLTTAATRASVGRLAPSPTGALHLGHARTFLLAWWHARSRGGRIVLRMEDLDAPRHVPGAADAILRDLEWLGLDWDGEPLLQSSRLAEHRAVLSDLVARGLAYPCVCTRGDVLRAQGAPQAGVAELRYPGTCRGRFGSVEEAERISGKPPALRFVVPLTPMRLVDSFAPEITVDVAEEVGDFVIGRKGLVPSYQLAVVLDDAAQGVTEIVRGDDLLASTARQRLLQDALGVPFPRTWHVPLVVDETGRRLAKRSNDVSLAELRSRGVSAEAIVGWAARTSGIDGVKSATPAEICGEFALSRVPHAPVVVRVTKTEDPFHVFVDPV